MQIEAPISEFQLKPPTEISNQIKDVLKYSSASKNIIHVQIFTQCEMMISQD